MSTIPIVNIDNRHSDQVAVVAPNLVGESVRYFAADSNLSPRHLVKPGPTGVQQADADNDPVIGVYVGASLAVPGDSVPVAVSSLAEVIAGASVSAGDMLATNAIGRAIPSSSTGRVIGVALSTAAQDGDPLLIAIVQAAAAAQPISGALVGFQVLTGAGTYVPSAGISALLVISIGAGGGAGGLAAQSLVFCATAGGGAGAIARSYVSPLAASYAYSCGGGGAGGVGNNAGGNGGQTTFGAEATASGGQGSGGVNAAGFSEIVSGGLGGSIGGAGQYKMAGQAGWPAIALSSVASSGAGGSTPYGTGGASGTGTGNGFSGSGFGAGGGGAVSGGSATNRDGGAGSNGAIIVWEFS